MTDINKNFKVKNGLETPELDVSGISTFRNSINITNTQTTSTIYNAQVSFDTTNPPVPGFASLSSYPGATKFASTLSGAGITIETFRTSTGFQKWHFSRSGSLVFPGGSSYFSNSSGSSLTGPSNAPVSISDGNTQSLIELTTSTGMKLWTDWQTATYPTANIQSNSVIFKDAFQSTTFASFTTNTAALIVTDGTETVDFNLDPTSGLVLTDANTGAIIQAAPANINVFAYDGATQANQVSITSSEAKIGVVGGESGGLVVSTRGVDLAVDVEIKGGADQSIATFSTSTIVSAVPFTLPNYTAAQAGALTGSVGQMICINDSAAGGDPDGMIAFWDTTNARWSYVHNNSAV
jgi:hypothetical protein